MINLTQGALRQDPKSSHFLNSHVAVIPFAHIILLFVVNF